MPRAAREKSKTGIYHVMLRGINQQQIFEDEEDYGKFLKIVKDCKEVSGFKMYAYCLMGNHVHLLIKEENESTDQIIKRIGTRFVYWYNVKYRRKGHLFQDRYRSEPVNDMQYFGTVMVYIHRNPVKAGICKKPEDYRHSSYNEYLNKAYMTDTDYLFENYSKETFMGWHKQQPHIDCLDIQENLTIRYTDEEAEDMIKRVSRCQNIAEFQTLETAKRDKCLKKLRERGLSIRQLSRLTGISIGIVRKF